MVGVAAGPIWAWDPAPAPGHHCVPLASRAQHRAVSCLFQTAEPWILHLQPDRELGSEQRSWASGAAAAPWNAKSLYLECQKDASQHRLLYTNGTTGRSPRCSAFLHHGPPSA